MTKFRHSVQQRKRDERQEERKVDRRTADADAELFSEQMEGMILTLMTDPVERIVQKPGKTETDACSVQQKGGQHDRSTPESSPDQEQGIRARGPSIAQYRSLRIRHESVSGGWKKVLHQNARVKVKRFSPVPPPDVMRSVELSNESAYNASQVHPFH